MRKYINSDGVVSVRYTKEFVDVEFSNGITRRYQEVPYGVYSDMLNAKSKLKFIKLILNQYDYVQMAS